MFCECVTPFIADPMRPGTERPFPMGNRWPECRACGRIVRQELDAKTLRDLDEAAAVKH